MEKPTVIASLFFFFKFRSFSYAEDNVELLSTILHASVRGLNSVADLEVLQGFYEKYFGNAVENKNPTLVEVFHFEEEVLRQKIEWREKYEGVISGWLSSKATKSKLVTYHAQTEPASEETANSDALNEPKDERPPAPEGSENSTPAKDEAAEKSSASGDGESKSAEKTAAVPSAAADGNASTVTLPGTGQPDTPAASTSRR